MEYFFFCDIGSQWETKELRRVGPLVELVPGEMDDSWRITINLFVIHFPIRFLEYSSISNYTVCGNRFQHVGHSRCEIALTRKHFLFLITEQNY